MRRTPFDSRSPFSRFGRFYSPGGVSFFYTISIAGLTSNPTYGTTAQIGVELTASVTNWSSDPPISVSWQWYDGSGAISGATSATYTPVSGDDLEAIYATATPSDTYDPKNSAAYTVRYAPAVNTVAPVASGDTSLGDTLATTNGTWTGATGGSYSYQWQRAGVDISGATASTHDIVAADDAADLRCVVTYTNSGGVVSANSNAVTVDDFAAPSITGSTTISGTEQVGQTLTATAASVTGNPTPSRTWQWVNSASGDIPGATSSTYTLQASDEGDTISVRQTETNGLGSDTATSAATGAIAAAPAVATITINSIGPQEASGDVPVDYTIDVNDSTVEVLIALAATAAPAASVFGADSGGGADAGGYTDCGTVNLTTSGSPINLTIPTGLDDSYKIHLLPTGGGDSDVASSAAVTIDTTAPAYASSTPADEGTDIAIDTTIAITFDEAIAAGTGTFVLYDVTGAATVETFTVGGTGDNGGTISISTPTVTLTPGANLSNSNAYSVRWTAGAITDAYSNPVAANSTDTLLNFTTVELANPLTVARIGTYQANFTNNTSPSFTLNLAGYVAGDTIYVFYGCDLVPTTASLKGNTYDALVTSVAGPNYRAISVWKFVLTADGTSSDTLALTLAANNNLRCIDVWGVKGAHTVSGASAWIWGADASANVTPTAANNVLIAVSFGETAATDIGWTGATQDEDSSLSGSIRASSARADDVTTSGATTVTATASPDSRHSIAVIQISDAA